MQTGFEIISARKREDNVWSLVVKAYEKEGTFSERSEASALTLCQRVEGHGVHHYNWKVIGITRLDNEGKYGIGVQKVENEKEDSSDEEEHVEAEE